MHSSRPILLCVDVAEYIGGHGYRSELMAAVHKICTLWELCRLYYLRVRSDSFTVLLSSELRCTLFDEVSTVRFAFDIHEMLLSISFIHYFWF